jgi:CubicO group peptidase (beta-lactamase class C family)
VALQLIEEGVLQQDQPIDDLMPELARRQVLRSLDAELDDTVAAHRSITVEDLLSFRMGFGSIMAPPDTYPIQRAEAAAALQSIGGPPWPPGTHTGDSWIAALGAMPLMCQPGDQWLYNTSCQVLGVLLGRAAGQPVDKLFRERIFEPLGMADTGFTVPPADLHRLATLYRLNQQAGDLSAVDRPPDSWWSTPPSLLDTSGWLVSTIDDYWTFVAMLMAGGEGGGQRILSPESVALMTTNRLTEAQRSASELFLGANNGWGLGLLAPVAGAVDQSFPCGIGWDGGTGTTWRTNLTTGVTGMVFTQREATSPEPPPLMRDFWAGLNAAGRND